MATASIGNPYDVITADLGRGLSDLAVVESVHFLPTESALSVWVSLLDGDDQAARNDVYHFEDWISERYPKVLFDFHIVAVPADRKIEDYVSDASPLFQRSIA
jgi:hypothetical protein